METGKSLAHDSAEMQVTGSALYTDDTVENAGELLVSFVGSPVAHGLLKVCLLYTSPSPRDRG